MKAGNGNLVKSIDASLENKGLNPETSRRAIRPPDIELPEFELQEEPPSNIEAVLSKVDERLKAGGVDPEQSPLLPEALTDLRLWEKSKEKTSTAKGAEQTSTTASTRRLLEGIDQNLEGKGIEAPQVDLPAKREMEPARQKRPKRIELSPRLSTETGPLFLGEDQKPADNSQKPAGAQPKFQPLEELPKEVVKGPPAPPEHSKKEETPETKVARSSSGEDEETEKGVFEEIKENLEGIGKLFRPFNW